MARSLWRLAESSLWKDNTFGAIHAPPHSLLDPWPVEDLRKKERQLWMVLSRAARQCEQYLSRLAVGSCPPGQPSCSRMAAPLLRLFGEGHRWTSRV
jgi:hypothetical protein